MKFMILALAFIAAAGTAGAQNTQAPAPASRSPDAQINSGASLSGAAGAASAPDMARVAAHTTNAAATAQKRIEMDGYKDVQGLAKGPDGLWHGTALRGNTSVQVTVDRAGNVAAK